MRFLNAVALTALLGAAAAPGLSAQASMPADSLAHARKLTDWFFTARHDSLLPYFANDGEPMTAEKLQEGLEEFTARAGLETEVVEEKFIKRNGNTQYWRTGRYTIYEEPVLFRWAFNKQGQIIGIGYGPASQAPPIDKD